MADYQRIRTPFVGMSFTPDVPSNALAPNEYNSGYNVESDVRGVKKIYGEQEILTAVPGQAIFMEGGFRSQTNWVYIVSIPSRVPVNPKRYFASHSFETIEVNDFAFAVWHSSQITTLNFSKYDFGILYNDCQVEI